MTARALLVCALLTGCGYRTGVEPPPGYHTVGVEVFANDSETELVPDLERDLSEELGRAVERLVQAPLVPPERADVVVTGRIRSFQRRRGIRDENNQLQETGVRISVEAQLVRGPRQDREVIRQTTFATRSGFVTRELGAEEEARRRVLANIADRLVLDLFSPVAYEP